MAGAAHNPGQCISSYCAPIFSTLLCFSTMSESDNTGLGKQQRVPSSKLASTDNVGDFELNSHRDARQRAAHSAVKAVPTPASLSSRTPTSTRLGSVTVEDEDDPEVSGLSDSTQAPPKKRSRTTRKFISVCSLYLRAHLWHRKSTSSACPIAHWLRR